MKLSRYFLKSAQNHLFYESFWFNTVTSGFDFTQMKSNFPNIMKLSLKNFKLAQKH